MPHVQTNEDLGAASSVFINFKIQRLRPDEAASTIDSLGPHLTDENIDLIYHIGMVLKQLERSEEVKTMLVRANTQMPGNQHVSSAMAHLGV